MRIRNILSTTAAVALFAAPAMGQDAEAVPPADPATPVDAAPPADAASPAGVTASTAMTAEQQASYDAWPPRSRRSMTAGLPKRRAISWH